jgi:hypothetical protein
MWCIWKSRNDCIFNREKGEPYQIDINAQALCKNMEVLDPTENDLQIHPKPVMPWLRQNNHQQGQIILVDHNISGAKIFSDASWKNKKVPGFIVIESTGIGIFIQFSREGIDFNIKI